MVGCVEDVLVGNANGDVAWMVPMLRRDATRLWGVVQRLLDRSVQGTVLHGALASWVEVVNDVRRERRDAFVDAMGDQMRAAKRRRIGLGTPSWRRGALLFALATWCGEVRLRRAQQRWLRAAHWMHRRCCSDVVTKSMLHLLSVWQSYAMQMSSERRPGLTCREPEVPRITLSLHSSNQTEAPVIPHIDQILGSPSSELYTRLPAPVRSCVSVQSLVGVEGMMNGRHAQSSSSCTKVAARPAVVGDGQQSPGTFSRRQPPMRVVAPPTAAAAAPPPPTGQYSSPEPLGRRRAKSPHDASSSHSSRPGSPGSRGSGAASVGGGASSSRPGLRGPSLPGRCLAPSSFDSGSQTGASCTVTAGPDAAAGAGGGGEVDVGSTGNGKGSKNDSTSGHACKESRRQGQNGQARLFYDTTRSANARNTCAGSAPHHGSLASGQAAWMCNLRSDSTSHNSSDASASAQRLGVTGSGLIWDDGSININERQQRRRSMN